MVRTQVCLTKEQRAALRRIAAATAKARSELIREASDALIARSSKSSGRAVLRRLAGMWKDRRDLPDFAAMRKSWDRGKRP